MRVSVLVRTLALVGPLAFGACVGNIDGDTDLPAATGSDERKPGGPRPAEGPGGMPGGNEKPVVPGAPNTGGPAADANAAGPRPLRRLTNREYDNTVRDLLGDTTRPAGQFPGDHEESLPFRRAGSVAVQDGKVLREAAEALAAAAVAKLSTLLPCDPASVGEAMCLGKFIEGFAARAYRRPLTPAEGQRIRALFATARNDLKLAFPDAIGFVIEGLLQAPQFLYHWEAPPGAATKEGTVIKLSPYEVASRLSYFLWGSMPDQELFAAEVAGRLGTAAEVETHARRLIADPKARDTVDSFFFDWLGLGELASKPKNATAYPAYGPALMAAMQDETRAFAQSVVFDGDGTWATLLKAKHSFVNQGLAGVYGMTEVKGSTLQRANLNPAQRAGLLTQAAFLSVTGSSDGSNPSLRGLAVVIRLLCGEVPPPPPNVPLPAPASAGGTTRERFMEHDKNECARGCHAVIDPIGFTFENYDGIGQYRTMDNGKPVDASGSIPLDGRTIPLRNALDLAEALGGSAEARGCFTTQWMRFALARDVTSRDQASLNTAAAAFGPTAGVRDLLVSLATSRSFRYRAPASGEVLP